MSFFSVPNRIVAAAAVAVVVWFSGLFRCENFVNFNWPSSKPAGSKATPFQPLQ